MNNSRHSPSEPSPEELARELREMELATSPTLVAGEKLSAETQALREAFLALGRALEREEVHAGLAVSPPALPLASDCPPGGVGLNLATPVHRSRSLPWHRVGVGAALALSAAAVFVALATHWQSGADEPEKGSLAGNSNTGEPASAVAAQGEGAVPREVAPPTVAEKTSPAALAWDDAFDDELAQASDRLWAVRASFAGSAGAAVGLGERLDEFTQELDAEPL